jgi:hypothetical protein
MQWPLFLLSRPAFEAEIRQITDVPERSALFLIIVGEKIREDHFE